MLLSCGKHRGEGTRSKTVSSNDSTHAHVLEHTPRAHASVCAYRCVFIFLFVFAHPSPPHTPFFPGALSGLYFVV